MKSVILYTIMMMGIAFAMGFIVAYLVKVVTQVLYVLQNNSFQQLLERRIRVHRISAIRSLRAREITLRLQRKLKLDVLDHFYALQEQKKQSTEHTNELVEHYYGGNVDNELTQENTGMTRYYGRI